MRNVLTILLASLLFLAGLVVSALGTAWVGALLCTVGAGVGLALLFFAPSPGGQMRGSS